MLQSLARYICLTRNLLIIYCLCSIFVMAQWAFFNQYENTFLYEKMEYKEPYPNNIQGLLQTGRYFATYCYSKNSIVFQNKIPMKKMTLAQFNSTTELPVYADDGTSLFFKPETLKNGPVILYTPRPVLKIFSLPIIYVLSVLLICICDGLRYFAKKYAKIWIRERNWLIGAVLISTPVVAALMIIHSNPLLGGGQADAYGYVLMSYWPLETIAGSLRTPGYPFFLTLMRQFSPSGLYSTFFCQALIYTCGLSYLIFALLRLGFNRYLGILLLCLFQFYFYDFHANVLADSLGLSGIVWLIAGAIHFGICCVEGKKFKMAMLLCLLGGICIIQLMVKPFPGTILIAPAITASICWQKLSFKKNLIICSLLFLVCILPASSYCTYRYVKFKNFNFASLANISLSVQNIAMCDESVYRNEKVSDDTKKLVQYLVDNHRKYRPEYKWPIVFDNTFNNYSYTALVNSLWFHSDYYQYLRKSPVWDEKLPLIVNWDNAAAPHAKGLLWQVPLERRLAVIQSYWTTLWKIKIAEKYNLTKFYPFSSSLYCFTLIFPCILLFISKLSCYRRKEKSILFSQIFDIKIAALLLLITFFVPFCFLSTTFLIAPFCEIRREIIGLWGYYFGWTALSFYLSYAGIHAFIRLLLIPAIQSDSSFGEKCTQDLQVHCRRQKIWNWIKKYNIDRLFILIVLSSLIFYSFFYIPERISLFVSSDHDVKIHIKSKKIWQKNQKIVIPKSASPQFVSLFFRSGFLANLQEVAIEAPPEAKTSLHAMQMVTKNRKYEYFHGNIQTAFSFLYPERIKSVDTRYGITFQGSQKLTPSAKEWQESKKIWLTRPLPGWSERFFPNWTSSLLFLLFLVATLVVSCRCRTLGRHCHAAGKKLLQWSQTHSRALFHSNEKTGKQ